MAPQMTRQKWYSIAEQASKETDPKKLRVLIDQLCRALDERARRRGEMYGSATVDGSPLPANSAGEYIN